MVKIYKEAKLVFLISSICVLSIFLCGIYSDLFLGDEVFHYRIAKYYYYFKSRPIFDQLIHTNDLARTYYIEPVLWHYTLSLIWSAIGNISNTIMQLYQSFFLGILIFSVYFFAKDLYGKETAINSALLVASMPFFISFSILCYLDVPMISFLFLSILLLCKGHYFLSGLSMGLSILMKRNAMFFVFPLIFLLVYRYRSIVLFKKLSFFIIPMILVLLPDLWFRYTVLFKSYGLFSLIKTNQPEALSPIYSNPPFNIFLPDGIFSNPISIIKYLGLISIFGLSGYIISKKYEIKDLLIFFPIIIYMIFYFIFFDLYATRYLAPLFPFFAILAGKGLVSKSKKIVLFIIISCLVQFSAVIHYTYTKRHIPNEIKESMEFIKKETPVNSRFMVPEIFIAEYASRPMIWYSRISLVELPYLFWMANEEEAMKIFKRYNIKYIMVLKDRIYDDTRVHHLGGFPGSFIQKMRKFNFLRLIFENEKVSLWELFYN